MALTQSIRRFFGTETTKPVSHAKQDHASNEHQGKSESPGKLRSVSIVFEVEKPAKGIDGSNRRWIGFIRLPGGDRFEEVAVECLRTWPLRIYGIGLTSGIGLSHKVNSRYGPSDKLFMFFYDSCVLFLHIKI